MHDGCTISNQIGMPRSGMHGSWWLHRKRHAQDVSFQITCSAIDDKTGFLYDLTPLINSKENYLARINDTLNGNKAAQYVVRMSQ